MSHKRRRHSANMSHRDVQVSQDGTTLQCRGGGPKLVTLAGLTSGAANALNSLTTAVNTSLATAPTANQLLVATGAAAAVWRSTLAGLTLTSPTITGTGAIAGTFTGNLTGNADTATAANGLKSATTTVAVSAATAPSVNQILVASNSSTAAWASTLAGLTLTSPTITGAGAIAGAFTGNLTGTADVANGLKSATTTVVVSGATAPSAGQALTATSSTVASWAAVSIVGLAFGSGTGAATAAGARGAAFGSAALASGADSIVGGTSSTAAGFADAIVVGRLLTAERTGASFIGNHFYNGTCYRGSGNLTTTDASATPVMFWSLGVLSTTTFQALVSAFNTTTGTDAASWRYTWKVRTSSGGAHTITTVDSGTSLDAGLSTATVVLTDVGSGGVNVYITGIAATTVKWALTVSATYCS